MSESQGTSPAETAPGANRENQETTNVNTSGGRRHRRDRHHRQQSGQSQQQQSGRRPEAALNIEELRELVQLLAEHDFNDFYLEREGFRVRLRRDLAPPPAATQTAQTAPVAHQAAPSVNAATSHASAASTEATSAPAEKSATEADEEAKLETIVSPIVGTFYRSPSPTAEPFVKVGSTVEPDTVVCIVEAMKLMNEIQAETSGVIAKIYVENGQPVEYGQPLFGVRK